MADVARILNKQMLFHLDAASAHAEELGEMRLLELIDQARELTKRGSDRATSNHVEPTAIGVRDKSRGTV